MKWLPSEHHEMVATLSKPGSEIRKDLIPGGLLLIKILSRQYIELCKTMDIAKKIVIYNQVEKMDLLPAEIKGEFSINKLVDAHSISDTELELIHHMFALAGEMGEVIEPLYNALFSEMPYDFINLHEELGDCAFYEEGVRQALNMLICQAEFQQLDENQKPFNETRSFSRESLLEGNCNKLSKRYASGSFSNQQAKERADKT